MLNWAVVASEFINVAAAVIFIAVFSVYLYRIQRRSETHRFVHLYPYRRIFFVAIYIIITIVEVIMFLIKPISSNGQFNIVQLYFLVGTCLNSLILVFQLFILYVEIKKETKLSLIHQIYWIYLTCISLLRLILEAYYEKGIDVTVYQLVLSSLLFTDAIVLSAYSWLMHKTEIKDFSNLAEIQFNILNNSSRSNGQSKSFNQETFAMSSDGIFPYLNVQLRLHNNTNILTIKTYSNSIQISRSNKTIDQLTCFYNQSLKLKLKTILNFLGDTINLISLQQFFSQLLSNWTYYQPFVLDFLNVDQQTKKQINRCRSQHSGHTHISTFDPYRIYFDIRLPNIVKNVDHHEFDVIVQTNDHQCNKTVHKRYSQFEDLDRKLRGLDFKGLKLRTPDLPQKIYFNQSDQDKLEQRRSKLQVYIKRLMNDKVFIKTHIESRAILFDFFRLDCQQFALVKQNPLQYDFSRYSYQRQMITKQVTEKGEPVTFYYFIVFKDGERIGTLKKRFRMFDQFNQQFKRWMHNTQTQYKSVKLPTKTPQSSQSQKLQRHSDLVQYLNNLILISNLSDFYQAKCFLCYIQQQPMSPKRSPVRRVNSSSPQMVRKSSDSSLLQSYNMSKMSELIQNLNFGHQEL